MSKYCGIDLHARSVQMCIIDEFGDKVKECRQEPDLKRILAVLAGHGPDVQVAVESTNNWYWLVDGLAAAGYEVHLAHAYGLRVISQSEASAAILGSLLKPSRGSPQASPHSWKSENPKGSMASLVLPSGNSDSCHLPLYAV